jgi:uncharacterized protein (TIGR00730 family)
MIKNICINCGSSPGLSSEYIETARLLGKELAGRNIRIVYGGARFGLMGAVADASIENGGEVVGVITGKLAEKVRHHGLADLHIVDTMHERKRKMLEMSDAVIVLPGGFGTLEELFELLTQGRMGCHEKPCGIVNVNGYYDLLLQFIDSCIEQRFVTVHKESLLVRSGVSELLAELLPFRPFYVKCPHLA